MRSLKLPRITASAGFGTFLTLEALNFDEEFYWSRENFTQLHKGFAKCPAGDNL